MKEPIVEVVAQYKRQYLSKEDWQLSDFKNQNKPLEKFIEDAVYGYLPNRKRDSHQCDISKKALEEMVVKILMDPNIIVKLQL